VSLLLASGGSERLLTLRQDQYDAAFAAFQQSFHYDPTTFLAQPHPTTTQSPHIQAQRHDSMVSMPDMDMANLNTSVNDVGADEPVLNRSSSEEKDSMTPQQSRRKAQNRAA
jgi:hypothetical protein